MVWNFDVSFGFGAGMPYYPTAYNIGMPNYLFIQPMYNTNPIIQQPYCSNSQTNPFCSTYNQFFNPVNFNFSPFYSYTNYPQLSTNNVLEQYPQFGYSAASQISSMSSTTDNANKSTTEKSKNNDVLTQYNSEKGNLLAQKAMDLSDDFHNQCSAHVNKAIEVSGLGMYTDADAYQMINILKLNANFKSIPNDTEVKDLPAGSVVVYNKGVAGYSDEFGHVEIATGDGRGVSDGITNEIKPNPSAIFIPV